MRDLLRLLGYAASIALAFGLIYAFSWFMGWGDYAVFAGIVVVVIGVLEEFSCRETSQNQPKPNAINRSGQNYPPDWASIAERIRSRDNHRCRNCGRTDVLLQVHHIVPLSRGGTNRDENLVTLCDECHKRIHPHMR